MTPPGERERSGKEQVDGLHVGDRKAEPARQRGERRVDEVEDGNEHETRTDGKSDLFPRRADESKTFEGLAPPSAGRMLRR